MADALLGLGGNLGDVGATFEEAIARLEAGGVRLLARSSTWRTPPWGLTDQPAFLNVCLHVETALDPRALLDLCLTIERDFGRLRDTRWGPRTLDLDILDIAGVTVSEPDLVLPHPWLTMRPFVLIPLAEIVPDRLVAGRTITDWAATVDPTGLERI